MCATWPCWTPRRLWMLWVVIGPKPWNFIGWCNAATRLKDSTNLWKQFSILWCLFRVFCQHHRSQGLVTPVTRQNNVFLFVGSTWLNCFLLSDSMPQRSRISLPSMLCFRDVLLRWSLAWCVTKLTRTICNLRKPRKWSAGLVVLTEMISMQVDGNLITEVGRWLGDWKKTVFQRALGRCKTQ